MTSKLLLSYMSIIGLALLMVTCKDAPEQTIPSVNQSPAKVVPQPESQAPIFTILFYGNSLTAGYGLDKTESFPARIQEKLDSLNMNVKVINGGLSGETTSSGLNRLDWVLKQQVDLFVLELGANDMLRGLPVEQTRANLEEILQKVRSKYPNARLALSEMMAPPNMGEAYAKAFQQIYIDLAEKYEATFIPFFLINVVGNKDLMLPDGKHPNADGQLIVADYIFQYIQELLPS